MRYMHILEDLDTYILASGTATHEDIGPTDEADEIEHGSGTEEQGIEATEVDNLNDADY